MHSLYYFYIGRCVFCHSSFENAMGRTGDGICMGTGTGVGTGIGTGMGALKALYDEASDPNSVHAQARDAGSKSVHKKFSWAR